MPPVGFPSYNHDFMVTYSLLAANQVMSLIFDGVFDRFPTLHIVFVEHAFTWILPLMWRMDAIYEARKSWVDIKRKPSEYVKDHIKFTTQPLDYPEDKPRADPRAGVDGVRARSCCISSDYPHWTFDDPAGWSSTCPSSCGRAHVRERHRDVPPAEDGPGPRGPSPGVLRNVRRACRLSRGPRQSACARPRTPPGAHRITLFERRAPRDV